jgi:hydrogenase maturation factor
MIKSIDDPTKERYVLISLVPDFNLVLDYETQRGQYDLVHTEVAIAIQFE